MLDETVAAWLYEPEDDEEDEAPQNARATPPREASRPATPTPKPAAARRAAVERPGESPPASGTTPPRTAASPKPTPAPVDPTPRAPEAVPAVVTKPTPSPTVAQQPNEAAQAGPAAQPCRLTLRQINPNGAVFTFCAQWLHRDVFRASMPFSCLACQLQTPRDLIARPLGWFDQSRGRFATPADIESRYAVHVHDEQRHRDFIASMVQITELASPFNNPMPYFVCGQCAAAVKVDCQTLNGPNGIECRVAVPLGPGALAWLGRVNGVCGVEFGELESALSRPGDDQLMVVSDQVRARLSVWCRLASGEHFLKYVPDSDFTSHDAGRAGLVVTNQRVFYCKHHHRGSIGLDEHGELSLIKDGPFYEVHFRHDHQRRRLVRVRGQDGHDLIDLLDELNKPLRVVRSTSG